MANTEKLKLIRFIRETKKSVRQGQYNDATPSQMMVQLENLYDDLDALEDTLILQEIEDNVQSLEETSERLVAVSSEINETYDQFKELSDRVEKIGKGLARIIDFSAKIKDLF